jgi:hypothetical protein
MGRLLSGSQPSYRRPRPTWPPSVPGQRPPARLAHTVALFALVSFGVGANLALGWKVAIVAVLVTLCAQVSYKAIRTWTWPNVKIAFMVNMLVFAMCSLLRANIHVR